MHPSVECLQLLVDVVAHRHECTVGEDAFASPLDVHSRVVITIQMGCAFDIVAMAQTTNRETRSTTPFFVRRGFLETCDTMGVVDLFTRPARRAAYGTRLRRVSFGGRQHHKVPGEFVPQPLPDTARVPLIAWRAWRSRHAAPRAVRQHYRHVRVGLQGVWVSPVELLKFKAAHAPDSVETPR